jgi:hypothetical protein
VARQHHGQSYIIDRQAEHIDGAAIRRLVTDGEKARRIAAEQGRGRAIGQRPGFGLRIT